MNFKDKTFWITGASSGIGEGIKASKSRFSSLKDGFFDAFN
jgi:short-subunit dehydrogenase